MPILLIMNGLHSKEKKLSQTNFRTEVIKQMIKSASLGITRNTPGRPSTSGLEFSVLLIVTFLGQSRETLRIE